jgi:hypothetical protein
MPVNLKTLIVKRKHGNLTGVFNQAQLNGFFALVYLSYNTTVVVI